MQILWLYVMLWRTVIYQWAWASALGFLKELKIDQYT